MKIECSRHIFEQFSNIKVDQHPSIGSQVVPCGQTDKTMLIVAFRNFANTPKNESGLSDDLGLDFKVQIRFCWSFCQGPNKWHILFDIKVINPSGEIRMGGCTAARFASADSLREHAKRIFMTSP
jgi:hypothetical protein